MASDPKLACGQANRPGRTRSTLALAAADAAVAFLRDPATVAKYGLAPRRIFVAGHSMGGFMAASAATQDPDIAGLVMILAWDIGPEGAKFRDPAYRKGAAEAEFNDDVIPLAGTSVDALMDEAEANAGRWDFVGFAPALRSRPVLMVSSDDGNYPDSRRLAEALRQDGDPTVVEIYMTTDHPYSDHRIALESAVVDWLKRRIAKSAP